MSVDPFRTQPSASGMAAQAPAVHAQVVGFSAFVLPRFSLCIRAIRHPFGWRYDEYFWETTRVGSSVLPSSDADFLTECVQDTGLSSGPGLAGLPAMLGMGPGGMPKRSSGIDTGAIQQVCVAESQSRVVYTCLYIWYIHVYISRGMRSLLKTAAPLPSDYWEKVLV